MRRPSLITFSVHLVAAYTCVVLLAVLQWLAGGWHAPYHELLLALALGNALTHPPRRFAPLMLAIWLSALAPLIYEGDHDQLASVIIGLLLWTGMSGFCLVLMVGIRAHREGLTAKGEAAERMARIDALTGLENRRAFDEAFARALARGRRSAQPLTLVLADLDGFKQVNDLHGHLAGDAVLTAVAAALRLHARGTDRAFRWAGDEFALLLEDTDPQTAAQVCSRLREAIARAVATPAGAPVTITLGWARDDGAHVAGAARRGRRRGDARSQARAFRQSCAMNDEIPPALSTPSSHVVEFGVEYPERQLNRLTSAFRIFTVIPIAIVLSAIGGSASFTTGADSTTLAAGGSGLLVLPPLLMILFRRKYPRWWYDFNLELLRFQNRVGVYFALMDDRYPSTDERAERPARLPVSRCDPPEPLAAAREVAARDPALHGALLPLRRRACSRSSPRGSRSSSRAASRAGSSITSSASAAGRTASPRTRSSS